MRSFGETHEPVPPEPGPVGTGSTAEQRGRRHFGWVKPRLAVALDGRFAWRHRMAVMMRGRSTARAELVCRTSRSSWPRRRSAASHGAGSPPSPWIRSNGRQGE